MPAEVITLAGRRRQDHRVVAGNGYDHALLRELVGDVEVGTLFLDAPIENTDTDRDAEQYCHRLWGVAELLKPRSVLIWANWLTYPYWARTARAYDLSVVILLLETTESGPGRSTFARQFVLFGDRRPPSNQTVATVLPYAELPAEDRAHPAQKPVGTLRKLLQLATTADHPQAVVDPFLGSGVLLDAADAMGWQGLGVEIDPDLVSALQARWARALPEAG